jgi:hypothetical protein
VLLVVELTVVKFPVVPLNVIALLVVALLVEALDVWKLDVVPKRDAIVALEAVKFVMIAVAAFSRVAKKLVLVELVIVE